MENLLDLQIRNLNNDLCQPATNVLSLIQIEQDPNPNLIFGKLQCFFSDLSMIRDILQHLSSIASESPLTSIKVFCEKMPKINIDSSSKPPESHNYSDFLAYIKIPINWSNYFIRIGMALYTEVVIAVFCLEIVEMADLRKKKNEVKTILERILKIIDSQLDNSTYNRFRIISASIWSDVLYYLSKIDQNPYLKLNEFLLNTSNSLEDDKKAIYFALYSKVCFSNVHQIDKSLKKQLTDIKSKINKSSNIEFREAGFNFLSNYIANLCFSDESFRDSSKLINNFFPKRFHKQSGPYLVFYAYLLVFTSQDEQVISHKIAEHYYPHVQKPEYARYILKSFIIFLRGFNYQAIYKNGDQYQGPHIITSHTIINAMFDQIYENSEIYSYYQSLMTEFLAQIAVVDIEGFTDICQKIFQERSPFLSYQYTAVFDTLGIITYPAYKFPIDDSRRANLIEFFRKEACGLIKKNDPTSETNWSKVVALLEAFSVKSFVESVILHQKDMSVVFYLNQIESIPHLYVHPKSKMILGRSVRKWTDILPKELKNNKVFISDDHCIATYNQDLIHENVLPSAICIIPLASPNINTFNDLMTTIYSDSVAVAAASIRAIQSLVFIDKSKEIVHAIFSKIDFLISKRMISSNGVLYRTLYSLYLMLDAIVYTNESLTEQSVDLLNISAIIGFCSSTYDIRLIGYNIGKLIDSKTKKMSVTAVFDENSEQISFLTRINSLSSVSYKNYTTADKSSITAFDILQSEYSILYQFELAVFSNLLKNKLEQSCINDIRSTILNVLLSTKISDYIDPLFFMNLIIFLVNASSSQDYSHAKSLINLYVQIMDKFSFSEKYGDAPYFSLLSQIDTHICMSLIADYAELPEQLYLPLMYALRRHTDTNSIQFHNSLIFKILSFFENIITIFASDDRKGNESNTFSRNKLSFQAPANPDPHLKEQLISFLQIAEIILDFLKFNNQRNPANTFLRVPIFDKGSEAAHFKIDSRSWYIFLLNIASLSNDLGRIAKKTLKSFMSLFEISQDIYLALFNKISLFEVEPSVINALLTQGILYMEYSYQYLLFEHICNEAHTNGNYFQAISTLYIDAKSSDIAISTIQEALRNKPYKSEERMFDITYKHSGSLLALAFYYILLRDGEVRAAGFRVLQAISLGLAVSQNKVIPKLCHLIDDIRPHIIISQHSTVSLEPCIQLSNLLAREFPLISGQFAFSLFLLIEQERCLSLILLPWISRVKLSSSNKYQKVLTKASNEFTMFTTDTFINCLLKLPSTKYVLEIISKAIKEQTEDSLNVLEFILMKILSSHLSRPAISNRYKIIIVYLYTLYPEKVLQILFQILSFDFWYYHNIQLFKYDALLDISDFLKRAAQSKASAQVSRDLSSVSDKETNENDSIMVSDGDSESDDDDSDVYDVTVRFVLDVFQFCINDNSQYFEPYIPDLALFSFITIKQYKEKTIGLLSKLLSFDPTNDSFFNKYIHSLDDIVKAKLSLSSLSWGLCCGEFELALNGLAFFSCIGLDVTDDIVDSILQTIYVISQCLYEKTHSSPNINIKQKSWLLMVTDANKDPNYKLCANYIENLVHIMSFAQPRDDVFWTIVSMLNLHSKDYTCLLNIAICSITKMLRSSSKFAAHISTSSKPENFIGLIPMIINCTFDQDTPSLFFDLFKFLDTLPDDQKKLGYNVDDPTHLYSFISSTISSIQLESNDITFSAHAIDKMSVEDRNIILKLLAHIIRQVKHSNLSLVYDICRHILTTNVSDAYVASLVSVVNASRNSTNYSYNELMKAVDKHGGKIGQDPFNSNSFPELIFNGDFQKIIEKDRPLNTTSVFINLDQFPLMMPLDTGFLMCPLVSKVKTSVEKVVAQPFSNWSDLIFKCRLIQSPQSEKSIDEKDIVPFPKIPVDTFNKWLHELTNFVYEDEDENEKDQLINGQESKGNVHKVDNVQEEQPYNVAINIIDFFNADNFLPDPKVIENIGLQHTLKDYRLPPVLPA